MVLSIHGHWLPASSHDPAAFVGEHRRLAGVLTRRIADYELRCRSSTD